MGGLEERDAVAGDGAASGAGAEADTGVMADTGAEDMRPRIIFDYANDARWKADEAAYEHERARNEYERVREIHDSEASTLATMRSVPRVTGIFVATATAVVMLLIGIWSGAYASLGLATVIVTVALMVLVALAVGLVCALEVCGIVGMWRWCRRNGFQTFMSAVLVFVVATVGIVFCVVLAPFLYRKQRTVAAAAQRDLDEAARILAAAEEACRQL